MFWEPLEQAVLGAEAFLESTVHWISWVLIFTFGEERRKSHGGGSDKIVGMIDACFKFGNRQVPCHIVGNIAVDADFPDGVYSDKVSK